MKFKLIGVIIISMLFFTGCTEKKEKLAVVSSNEVTVDNNFAFFVNIEQTKYKKPLTPDDDGFDMYKSRFYGEFALVSRNVSGEEIDRITLNQFFENRDMGFIGEFKLGFKDLNAEGNLDFGVGEVATGEHAHSGEFQYVIFSIDNEGKLKNLPVEGGYFYTVTNNHSLLEGMTSRVSENGTVRALVEKEDGHGYKGIKYVWNGNMFVVVDEQ